MAVFLRIFLYKFKKEEGSGQAFPAVTHPELSSNI